MRIILHINELQKMEQCINNATNIKKNYNDSVIEILAHGSAVIPLQHQVAKNFNMYEKLKGLSENNVIIAVCNNSLTAYDIKKEALCSFVKVVKSGMIEIIDRQKEGYLYTKI